MIESLAIRAATSGKHKRLAGSAGKHMKLSRNVKYTEDVQLFAGILPIGKNATSRGLELIVLTKMSKGILKITNHRWK